MEDKYAAQPEQEIAPKTPDADDVDALLQDVKSLLGESDGETAEQPPPEDEPVPEGPGSEPLNAEDVHIDYGKFYGPEEQKEPEAPLTFYEQSKPACTARGIRAHPGAGAACKSRAPAGI